MSNEDDGSVRSVKDEAEMHRMIALAPPGNLHDALGLLSKKERYYLGLLWALGESIRSRNKVITYNRLSSAQKLEVNEKGNLKYPPINANNEIARIISGYPVKVNNYSGGTDGFRSRQITKANVSVASGPYNQPQMGDEKKPGWFARNILRKKSQSVTD